LGLGSGTGFGIKTRRKRKKEDGPEDERRKREDRNFFIIFDYIGLYVDILLVLLGLGIILFRFPLLR